MPGVHRRILHVKELVNGKRKNPSQRISSLRRVHKPVMYPRYHSNCAPQRTPPSGSSKPYALTRQSREGSTPGQPGFFLPTQELQTLASALPARTVRRLSEGHPRSTLRHRFYAAAIGRYSIAVPSYHIAVGLVKWKIKIICRGCISIRKLRGRGSVR